MASVRTRAAALMALILTLGLAAAAMAQDQPPAEPVTPDDGTRTSRVAGSTRIDTAVAIAQRAFPDGAPTAYLANADTVVDAVAGGSLTDGPILLVPRCDLPTTVADELARLRPQEVIALGGPGAVCDEVLTAAAEATDSPGDAPRPIDPDVVITATAEITDATSTPPFTVDVDDPGVVIEGGSAAHDITFTGTDGTVALDDPRFSGVLPNTDGTGQMVVTGRGCGPNVDEEGTAFIACQEDFLIVVVEEGEPTPTAVTVHTDDTQVGPTPLDPGTYVLEQPVRWDTGSTDGEVAFDDGQATIRITYTVTSAGGAPAPQDPVVTWSTPDGEFRTSGHPAADLDRIREGAAAGEAVGIPNGVIHMGDGEVNYGHDWHLTDIELADVAISTCDGTAAQVDADLDRYLEVGRFCPWGAVPIEVTG